MIEFKNVSYRYANTDADAVHNINLTVAPGELKVVTGASGCGKTTLMRLANGLAPQIFGGTLTGTITVAGKNVPVTPVAQLSESIGTLFQDPEENFFALNVGDEIAFALRARGVPIEEIEKRVESAAQRLGLTDLMAQDIHGLSEGQKQKVGLADILALGPKVLILDEPSANLDPEATVALAQTLVQLKNEGCAILVVDHRLYWLKDAADSVVVMAKGEIQAHGPFSLLDDAELRRRFGLRAAEVPDPRQTLPRIVTAIGQEVDDADSVFAAQHLSFAYTPEKPIFEDVSFAVPAGITALIGHNGTGKTTLARILTGLNVVQAGTFTVHGHKLDKAALMPHAGLVLQNADHQLQMRTVREELQSAVIARKMAQQRKTGSWLSLWHKVTLNDKETRFVEDLLTRLRLAPLAERHPQSLSGGEKQRVVIGCGLAKNPAILILDEPTSGLDGANMETIAGLLKDEAAQGRAVFLITHDLELLAACDRALDMKALQPKSTNS